MAIFITWWPQIDHLAAEQVLVARLRWTKTTNFWLVFHLYFVCFVTSIFPLFFVSSVRAFFYLIYLNSARFNSTFLLSKKTSPDRWFWLLGARERSVGRPADKQTATLETPEIKAISRKNVDFLKPPKSEPVKGKWPKCANAFFYTMIEQTRRYAAQ